MKTKRTGWVFVSREKEMGRAAYLCQNCGAITYVQVQKKSWPAPPQECVRCGERERPNERPSFDDSGTFRAGGMS